MGRDTVSYSTLKSLKELSIGIIEEDIDTKNNYTKITMLNRNDMPEMVRVLSMKGVDTREELLRNLGFKSDNSLSALKEISQGQKLIREVDSYLKYYFRDHDFVLHIPDAHSNYRTYAGYLYSYKKKTGKLYPVLDSLESYIIKKSELIADEDGYDFLAINRNAEPKLPVARIVLANLVALVICLVVALTSSSYIVPLLLAVPLFAVCNIMASKRDAANNVEKKLLSTSYNGLSIKAMSNNLDVEDIEPLKDAVQDFPDLNYCDLTMNETRIYPVLSDAAQTEDSMIEALAMKEDASTSSLLEGYKDKIQSNNRILEKLKY